jgi:DNA repair exonuclease SbcCD ATPase subunit
MIIFKKLRFKNFLSYGNYFTEVDFTAHKTVLISGKNGNGKSAIAEALCFSLFGKPYRNINKPNLCNSINEKDCLVELEFSIGNKSYLIRRGIKPNVFEIYCDGNLINQTAANKDYQKYLEQSILKLNFKVFSQLVLLGSSSYVPFMRLPAADRRQVIEDLLDITVFSRMNIVLKEKISALKEDLKALDLKIETVKEKIRLQNEYISKLKSKVQQSISDIGDYVVSEKSKVEKLQQEIDSKTAEIETLTKNISDEESIRKTLAELAALKRNLSANISQIEKSLKFYEQNCDCPSCGQTITDQFKTEIVCKQKNSIEKYVNALKMLEQKQSKKQNREKEINDALSLIRKNENRISILSGQVQAISANLNKLSTDFRKVSGDSTEMTAEQSKLSELQKENEEILKQKTETVDNKFYYEVAQSLLKDTGIKTKIIRQYLPLMNRYINKYLTSMDFFVNFNLDENFKEVIKSRHRDEFEYNSFSEGEKFRIDMALLLTWREISKQKNSTNTNILFLDEVFDSSLDASGTEEFLRLLKDLSKMINIFVISHKPDVLSDKFDHHMKVDKKGNFSIIL